MTYRTTDAPECAQRATRFERCIAWVAEYWWACGLAAYLTCTTCVWWASQQCPTNYSTTLLHIITCILAGILTFVCFVAAADAKREVDASTTVILLLVWVHWMGLVTGSALVTAFGG